MKHLRNFWRCRYLGHKYFHSTITDAATGAISVVSNCSQCGARYWSRQEPLPDSATLASKLGIESPFELSD